MPTISQARKVLLTIYDFLKTRLDDDGWSDLTFIEFSDGWPEDKQLVILDHGESAATGQVALPCIKLNMANGDNVGDVQIGGGLTEDEYFFDVQFQCKTIGQEMDLREFIRHTLDDADIFLLDWSQYPESPKPGALVKMDILGVSGFPIRDEGNPNIALRYAGMVSWIVKVPRSRTYVSNT